MRICVLPVKGGATILMMRTIDNILVGNIGRFMPQKNQKFLVDVMKQYGKGKLLIVGDGPLEDVVKRKASDNDVDLVILPPTKDIQDYYNAMDIFAFPSIYEGLGMVLIEAQINGLNCIASTAVPKAADITDSVVFEELDADKWCEKMVPRRSTKKILNDDYNIRTQAGKLVKIYEDLRR